MRKIVVLSFVTLDGVMQAPGGSDEDVSRGFTHGGWTVPLFDEFLGEVMTAQMGQPFDLLLGRKTYDIFAAYWPQQDEQALNGAVKYVASRSPRTLDWKPSVLLHGDVVGEIHKLKAQNGPDLQVHGSGDLIQTLLMHDLVDEFWLKIFPVVIGGGKRLFGDGTIPAGLRLVECKTSPSGVIIASYSRAGEVQTGSFA
jgi:dihydrofolate reductase